MNERAHVAGNEWQEMVDRIRTAERERDEAVALLREAVDGDPVFLDWDHERFRDACDASAAWEGRVFEFLERTTGE